MGMIRKIRRNMAQQNGHQRMEFHQYGSRPALSATDPWWKHPSFVRKMAKLGFSLRMTFRIEG